MPKTKKRSTTKRATRIAKAHASQLPPLEVKEAPRRPPGYKPPARGLARYPWLITLSLLVIAVAVGSLYYYHIGPFAIPAKPKTHVVTSPCLKVVKQLTDLSPAPGPATFNSIPHTFKQVPDMVINTQTPYSPVIHPNPAFTLLHLDPN